DRLIIRPWRVEEADRFFDIYRRRDLVRWLAAPPMQDRREAVEMIERGIARQAADPPLGSWAIVDRSNDIPAGSILLKRLPDGHGEIEIGWQLHPDSRGQGLATEAARSVLKMAFDHDVAEVWAVTLLANHRSVGVCRRVGMRLLGVTHRWYEHPSLMFWIGCRPNQEPSIAPDEPPPALLGNC
ncbi:MAG: GNAT family N-acetyltransferase, partial [Solirubrobacteraceae bacterium]